MSLGIFDNLPLVPKQLIVKLLLSNTVGVEISDRTLPITWLFSEPNENIEWESQENLSIGMSLWVDVWTIEQTEIDYIGHSHLATYVGILLATHWELVDIVYLNPLSF